MPNVPVTATHDVRLDLLRVEVPEAYIEPILKAKTGKLILPTAGLMPEALVTSRFIAKVALEAMAACICDQPSGIDYLVDESQLDAIRDHARKGKVISWPVKIRTIYAADASVIGTDGLDGQIVNEWDFLQTPANEWYFVLAIFGVEFAINMGGPDIEGYNAWLQENRDESPLYVGKNSIFKKPS